MSTLSDPSFPAQRASRIRLLVLDVDGVLTDGRLYYGDDGREMKVFHVRDGYGIKNVMAAGVQVAIISGRQSQALENRLAELKIEHAILGRDDKDTAVRELIEQLGIPAESVACVGDDLPDLKMMREVGLAIAVADAHPDVIAGTHWQTKTPGGRGAVREICDLLIAARIHANADTQ
jgi:3-deoxy-D-manno-octulosonate 8-phosphate phosphatase (KDO 8-P phosphatase)